MKEICVINQGENLKKIEYNMGIFINKSSIQEMNIRGMRSVILNEGQNNIIVVRNYNPYIIKKQKKEETLLDIYAKGFVVIGDNEYCDEIVIQKSIGVKYNVKPLEKIGDIARKFDVSKDYIMDTNNLKTEKLFIGQVLVI